MVSYELRQGQYITAIDSNENIVAAGLLFCRQQGEAQVDVVVAPTLRRQGIGGALVKRLVLQANKQAICRLVGHRAKGFWLAQAFTAVTDNVYALVLPHAAQQLKKTWYQSIPMAEFMALEISDFSAKHFQSSASMKSCINVHQSMFAGAIYSQAVLTGWGLIHLALIRLGLKGSIVLASGEMKYQKPITMAPCANAESSLTLTDFNALIDGKNCSIKLSVTMSEGASEQTCAIFSGRYVVLPRD